MKLNLLTIETWLRNAYAWTKHAVEATPEKAKTLGSSGRNLPLYLGAFATLVCCCVLAMTANSLFEYLLVWIVLTIRVVICAALLAAGVWGFCFFGLITRSAMKAKKSKKETLPPAATHPAAI